MFKKLQKIWKLHFKVFKECAWVKNAAYLSPLDLHMAPMVAALQVRVEIRKCRRIKRNIIGHFASHKRTDQWEVVIISLHFPTSNPAPETPGGELIYDIELVHAEQGPRHPEVFDMMDSGQFSLDVYIN